MQVLSVYFLQNPLAKMHIFYYNKRDYYFSEVVYHDEQAVQPAASQGFYGT